MKKCKNCGYVVNNDDQLYCPVCGFELDDPLSTLNVPENDNRQGGRSSFADFLKNPGLLKGSSRVRTLALGIIGVLAVLGIAALVLQSALNAPKASVPSTSGTPSSSLSSSQPEPATDVSGADASDSGANAGADAPAPTPAQATDTQVVFRNAAKDAVITVDGESVSFTYVGQDAVIPRDELKDVCIVRIIAPTDDGGYQTAAVWYNYRYGNDMTFGDPNDYGEYTSCDVSGLGEPAPKVVDVLTWAYYTSFLESINEQDASLLRYSTSNNLVQQRTSIYSPDNAQNLYDLTNYTAVCDPTSILYEDGTVTYNANFVAYPTNRSTGETKTISNHRTMRLVWDSGMWMVDSTAFLSDADFAAGNYAS